MITKDLAAKALSKLSTPTAFEYFFENLKSAEWIKPLKEVKPDIFKKPIPAVKTEQGWSLPWWPQSRYLARVADQAPNEVVRIILEMDPTDNGRIYDDIADAALKLPLKEARKLVPKLLTGLEGNFLSFLPEKCAHLAVKFAEARDCDTACKLIEKVLELQSIPSAAGKHSLRPNRVATRYFDYHYQEILSKVFPKITAACGLKAIKILDDKLLFALETEGDLASIESDYSYIWRPAIEDHGQNYPDSIKDHLIEAAREAYSSYIDRNVDDAEKVITELLKSKSGIQVRFGLYLLAKEQLKKSPILKDVLGNPLYYDAPAAWHEFSGLLNKRLGDLPAKSKKLILEQIAARNADKPGDEQSEKYNRIQKYRIYSMVQEHLAGPTQVEFESLKKEIGELEHPNFHSYSYGTWVGPTSPLDESELAKKSPQELISFLKSWEPSKEWFSSSREGLGRTLQSLIKKDPDAYLAHHKELLELNPTYLRSIVQALNDSEKSFDWKVVLELCQWISSRDATARPKAIQDEDPGFGWAKASVVRLLSKGFDNNSIPISLRKMAWQVLEPVTSDPDPDATHEEKYLKGDSEYYQYSINTTRGEALHAVVVYALWVKRQEKIPDDKSSFKFVPEVEKVLAAHLDLAIDPQIGMRAVYGRWLPWLILIDKNWVSENIDKILPKQAELSRYRAAVWNTYIVFCGAYTSVFTLLSEEYLFEIRRIPEQVKIDSKNKLSDPVHRLGEHLMVLYGLGTLGEPQESEHLRTFFELAPSDARENAVNFIGRSLKNNKKKDIKPDVIKRLMGFWAWRKGGNLETVRDELKEFGWWVISGKFDPDWVLPELDWVIRTTGWVEPDGLLFEELRQYVSSHTDILLSITRAYVDGPVKKGKAWLMKKDFMDFLVALKQKVKKKQKDEFIEMIDSLASAGYLEFRQLAKF